jgi:hypothetical protein
MRSKSLLLSLSALALTFVVSQGGAGWQMTGSSSLGGSNANQSTSGGNGTSGGSGFVCSKGGLGGAVTTTVSHGKMQISYSGVIIGNPSQVRAELTSYKDCVTTAPAKMYVSCHRMSAHAKAETCVVRFSTTPVKWGSTPGINSTPGWISACEANLPNPVITIPEKLAASTISYAPTRRWLLNLPVEWTYTNPVAPSQVQTQVTSASSSTCYGPTYSGTYHPKKGETITKFLSLSVTINNHVSSTRYIGRSGVAGNIYPDSSYAGQAGYGPTQSLQTVYCDKPRPLVDPNTLPTYTVLSQYTTLFNSAGVCNFDPGTQRLLGWVAAIHRVAPASVATASDVQFVLSQQYRYAVSYNATGTEHSNCYTDTTYPSGRVVDASCSTSGNFTFPTHTETLTANAVIARSAPVPMDYAYAKEVPYSSAG